MKSNEQQKYENLVVSMILFKSPDVTTAELNLHNFMKHKDMYYDALCDHIFLLLESDKRQNLSIYLDFAGQPHLEFSNKLFNVNCLELLSVNESSLNYADIIDYLDLALIRLEKYVSTLRPNLFLVK